VRSGEGLDQLIDPFSAPSSAREPITHAKLWERVPVSLRIATIDTRQFPWSDCFYSRGPDKRRTISLEQLPEPVRHEMVWWLCWVCELGEKVDQRILETVVSYLYEILDERRASWAAPLTSFVDLSLDDWLKEAKSIYFRKHSRASPASFDRELLRAIDRVRSPLAARYEWNEWWKADRWDPIHDPRVLTRQGHLRVTSVIDWSDVAPDWLREAAKWWISNLLSDTRMAWTSALNYKSVLAAQIAPYIAMHDIQPKLVESPKEDLRHFLHDFVGYLSRRTVAKGSRKGEPVGPATVALAQTVMSSFYRFMFSRRVDASRILDEPRWEDLDLAHLDLWPADQRMRRDTVHRTDRGAQLAPALAGPLIKNIDVLGLPAEYRRRVEFGAGPVDLVGLGDSQALRAFLIMVLTGLRASEVLLLDQEPVAPFDDGRARVDPPRLDRTGQTPVALLRYRPTTTIQEEFKTLPVGPSLVAIIREQQAWISGQQHREIDTHNIDTTDSLRFLFMRLLGNLRGRKHYSPAVLTERLRALAKALRLVESKSDESSCMPPTNRLVQASLALPVLDLLPPAIVCRYQL